MADEFSVVLKKSVRPLSIQPYININNEFSRPCSKIVIYAKFENLKCQAMSPILKKMYLINSNSLQLFLTHYGFGSITCSKMTTWQFLFPSFCNFFRCRQTISPWVMHSIKLSWSWKLWIFYAFVTCTFVTMTLYNQFDSWR